MSGRRLYSGMDLGAIFFYYMGFPVLIVALFGLNLTSLIGIGSFYLAKWLLVTQVFGLVPLTILDEMFLLDWDKNRANILTVMKIDKVKDPE